MMGMKNRRRVRELMDKKTMRILAVFEHLWDGKVLKKETFGADHHVSSRSVQRDLSAVRQYLEEQGKEDSLQYDRERRGYRLEHARSSRLGRDEVLAAGKILLDSDALGREEMQNLVEKMVGALSPDQRKQVNALLQNERFQYRPADSDSCYIPLIGLLSDCVAEGKWVSFSYRGMDGTMAQHRVYPQSVMYLKHHFWLIAYYPGSKSRFWGFLLRDMENVKQSEGRSPLRYSERFNAAGFRSRLRCREAEL